MQVYLDLQSRATKKQGGKKNSSAFLKAATTNLVHTIRESEKKFYVAHINSYLGDDPFLGQYLPLDPSRNDLFELVKDGVLLWYIYNWIMLCFPWINGFIIYLILNVYAFCSKLINVAVPGTIDDRVINTKQTLNLWERNENHTLCLNSAKAIGCTVVNIGTQDLVDGTVSFIYLLSSPKLEMWHQCSYCLVVSTYDLIVWLFVLQPHLVLGLISQIIKVYTFSCIINFSLGYLIWLDPENELFPACLIVVFFGLGLRLLSYLFSFFPSKILPILDSTTGRSQP